MIPVNAPWFTDLEERYVLDALKSGWVTTGPYCHRLEEQFAAYIGRKHAIAVSSGTSALWLALMALGLKEVHGRVLTQSYTCDAVANATIHATGFPPYVVDVDEATWGLRYDQVEKIEALDFARDIRAVILAHCYGVPARDTEALVALCRSAGIPLIEDASEAHGAELNGRKVGAFGDLSVFSFRGEKVLSGGQLGMVLTDDDRLARRIHQYAYNGLPSDAVRYWSSVPGMNCQPSHLNAALACAQLERVDELVAARRAVHERWRTLLGSTEGLTFQEGHGSPCWWLTGVVIDRRFTEMLPQDLAVALLDDGIQTRPGFYALHQLPHCRGTNLFPCPMSERLLRQLIILPSGPQVTLEQQEYIVGQMMDVVGR